MRARSIALVLAAAMGCAVAEGGSSPLRGSSPSSTASASSIGPAIVASASSAPGPALPDGVHKDAMHPFGTLARVADCAGCHAEVAAEWRSSLHRRSFTDPWFAVAYRDEPRTFCRDCHAPMTGALPDVEAHDEGISCATCHVRDDAIVSAKAGQGPHDTLVDPRWATGAACAGCHQFPFFSHADGEGPALMQQTIDEWSRSEAAPRGLDCADCHMPTVVDENGRPHRSHAFVATSKEMLAKALDVHATARRLDAQWVEVVLTLRVSGAGHAVPTGDPFRAIEVVVASAEGTATTMLARTFRAVRGRDDDGNVGLVRRDARDLRVLPDAPRVVTLRLRARKGARVRFTLSHLRTTAELAKAQGLPIGRTRFLEGDVVFEGEEKTP